MKWSGRKRHPSLTPLSDPHGDMALRATEALEKTVAASQAAAQHAEEAQRLFGAIRREIAVANAREVNPQ